MINLKEHRWFSDCFENSEATAFNLDKKNFSYSAIRDKILSVSAYYVSEGVTVNQKIPILFSDQYKFIISVYALWNIGAVPVLINNKLNKEEVYKQVEFIDSTVIITDLTEIEIESSTINRIIYNEESAIANIELRNPSFDETALMLFTSGSSGNPKMC